MAEGMTPTTNQTYGLVKYYGPTMGKTTAAKISEAERLGIPKGERN